MEQFTRYFHLPITDPVMVFAIVLFVIFLAPRLLQQFKVPGIIGMILSGALLGPNGFHVLEKSYAIELFGTVGLLYIMFQAGLEIDLNEFKKTRKKGMVFGLLSFAIPQVFGAIGVWYLLNLSWPSALLLASMFASHTLVAYSIISRLDLVRNEVVTVTLGGTLVVNILALLVLAVIASSVEGDLGAGFWLGLLISLSIFVYVVVEIGPRGWCGGFSAMWKARALPSIFLCFLLFLRHPSAQSLPGWSRLLVHSSPGWPSTAWCPAPLRS
jgi:Kef-type K+ transport system membrane component KefB